MQSQPSALLASLHNIDSGSILGYGTMFDGVTEDSRSNNAEDSYLEGPSETPATSSAFELLGDDPSSELEQPVDLSLENSHHGIEINSFSAAAPSLPPVSFSCWDTSGQHTLVGTIRIRPPT